MATLKVILTVIFVIVCIALTIIVLMQEGKSAGLGAISGAAETYWGKNKGRSIEGALEKLTRWLVVGFIVIAVILIPVSSKSEQTAAESGTKTNQNNNTELDTTNNNQTNENSGSAADVSSDAVDSSATSEGADATGSGVEE